MMRHLSSLVLVVALALLVAACGGGGSATLHAGDVAVVGSQTVTKADLDAALGRAKKSYATNKQKFPNPGTAQYEALKSQAVGFLVQRAELAQKAADMGIHISNTQIDDRISLLKKQFYGNNEQTYEKAIAAQGLTPDQARNEVRAQLIVEGITNKVTKDVKVTDKEVQDYYTANKAAYVQKASRDIRHILVATKALADTIRARLVAANEKNFAALAKKYSKDTGSAANGGRLTIVRGQTVKPFDTVAFALKKGELSQPVHTQYGWHVIQALSAIRPPQTTPLDRVKAAIRQQLLQQRKNDAMTKWFDGVKKEFCQPNKVKYQAGYAPTPDPCLAVTASTATT